MVLSSPRPFVIEVCKSKCMVLSSPRPFVIEVCKSKCMVLSTPRLTQLQIWSALLSYLFVIANINNCGSHNFICTGSILYFLKHFGTVFLRNASLNSCTLTNQMVHYYLAASYGIIWNLPTTTYMCLQ